MHETTQIGYGEGNITVTIDSETLTEVTAPEVRFGDFNAALKACFTAKELERIYAGEDANVSFSYVMRDALEDAEKEKRFDDAIAREEATRGTLHKGVFFDVEASKSVGDDEFTEIDMLYEEVEVQIEIPLYLTDYDYYYYVMTEVKGVCELEDDVDEEADSLSISTDKIGTSLMLYHTYDESLLHNETEFHIKKEYVFAGGLILLVCIWFGLNKLNRRENK